MLADDKTLATLDFFPLLERLERACASERGKKLAHELRPTAELALARVMQAQTGQMRDLIAGHSFSERSAIDTAQITGRAGRGSSLTGEDLRYVYAAQRNSNATVKLIRESGGEALREICMGHSTQSDLLTAIDKAIGEHGEMLDRASPALGRVRRALTQAQSDARERCQSIVRSSKFARMIGEPIVTVREGRYVIPIKVEFAGEFPGIVHDTSSSGQTVFIEPLSTLDSNNKLRGLRIEERYEIERILAELARMVGERTEAIERNVDILAQIDLVHAKATLAEGMNASPPEIVAEARIVIRSGRHPLLTGKAVPQSIELSPQQRIIIISGPNMGGKTVALKMVGLFVSLAYCGMHIPGAPPTIIGAIDRIFADVGDQQSIVENISTFAAHLRAMGEILDASNERALVLVDEIGGGTEPSAGAALATAMIERLLERRALVIVTTHATELKLFAHSAEGVINASVRFDPKTHAPTYELELGAPGQSLAFDLARAEHIDAPIVERAEALLSSGAQEYERALADLGQAREEAAAARRDLGQEAARARAAQEEARAAAIALETQRERFEASSGQRLDAALRQFRTELERRAAQSGARARPTAAQSELLSSVLDQLHRDLGITAPSPIHASAPKPGVASAGVELGKRVYVPALGVDADIIEDLGDNVLVAAGLMKTLVPKKALGPARGPERPRVRASDPDRSVPTGGRPSLDVRGKRFVEAEPLVESWIDEATLHGPSVLRLVHGKGTGVLGRSLQEALRAHPSVRSLRFGNADEGGSGVTILELRSDS